VGRARGRISARPPGLQWKHDVGPVRNAGPPMKADAKVDAKSSGQSRTSFYSTLMNWGLTVLLRRAKGPVSSNSPANGTKSTSAGPASPIYTPNTPSASSSAPTTAPPTTTGKIERAMTVPQRRDSSGGPATTRNAKIDGVVINIYGDKQRDKCAELVYDALAIDSEACRCLFLFILALRSSDRWAF
jgi:hypothetical protein